MRRAGAPRCRARTRTVVAGGLLGRSGGLCGKEVGEQASWGGPALVLPRQTSTLARGGGGGDQAHLFLSSPATRRAWSRWTDPAVVSEPAEGPIRHIFHFFGTRVVRSPCQEQTGISGGDGGQAHFSFILGNASCARSVPRWTDPVEVAFILGKLRTLRVRNMRSDPVVSEPVEARIRRVISSVSGMSCAHFVSRWTDPAVVSKPVEARIRRVIFLPFPA